MITVPVCDWWSVDADICFESCICKYKMCCMGNVSCKKENTCEQFTFVSSEM